MYNPAGRAATSCSGWMWITVLPLPPNFSDQLSWATPQYLKNTPLLETKCPITFHKNEEREDESAAFKPLLLFHPKNR